MKNLLTCMLVLWTGLSSAQGVRQRLNSLFQTQHRHQQLNGNVLAAQKGKIIYQNSFGSQDIARAIPNREETLFCLASVSKTITATAVLQLVESGKLRLDDPFAKYFPEFPYPAITIRQLLSHTSGLPDKDVLFNDSLISKQPDKVWQNSDILPALRSFGKLAFLPGDKWSYSNINYNLLALLMEKLCGLSYAAYLQRHIFKPAGMPSAYLETSLIQTKNTDRAINYGFSAPYAADLLPVATLPGNKKWVYTLNGLIGQGGLVMTVADLFRFDRALYKGKLLKPATLQLAFTPVVLNNKELADASSSAGQASYGLGWFILRDTSAGKIVFHTGRIPGQVNIFLRNLDKQETVIVLDNAESEAIYTTGSNALKIMDNRPERIRKLSTALYYSKALFKDGPDAGAVKLSQMRADSATYELDPGEMDFMGHLFLDRGQKSQGMEVFKVNLLLYPGIWQVCNSYAGALLKNGQQEQAKIIYDRALKLEPKNEEAIKALAALSGLK
ncbi:serine hydrolase [Mucilaginibacter sp. CAU 1740]|uniref:serine hydrolase domain-containing protein n=1 Tax=Mucilaginibacter sp. CAU 1740 TaxID=3140365 RepID=UPI00325AFC4C